jgi:hypothetical protein
MADDDKNSMNAWALLVVPLIIAGLIGRIIPAVDILLVENWQIAAYYGMAVLIGVVLFRRSRSEKDHEFHRVKNIKKLGKAYKAEDRGLWGKADAAMAGLERDAEGYQASDKDLIQGKMVKEVMREKFTGEISDDKPKEEVLMFTDEEHVRRSSARMSGDTDPMGQMSGAAVEMMKASGSGQTNVDEMMAQLSAEDERFEKQKKEKAPKPQPKPKPAPAPKPKPKPAVQPDVGGGQMGTAGKSLEDKLFDDLGASIGGGKSVGKETKICLDCGGRNAMGRANCSNCGSSLT